jgi:hypothetical protein
VFALRTVSAITHDGLRCAECTHEKLGAFSCKRRGFFLITVQLTARIKGGTVPAGENGLLKNLF